MNTKTLRISALPLGALLVLSFAVSASAQQGQDKRGRDRGKQEQSDNENKGKGNDNREVRQQNRAQREPREPQRQNNQAVIQQQQQQQRQVRQQQNDELNRRRAAQQNSDRQQRQIQQQQIQQQQIRQRQNDELQRRGRQQQDQTQGMSRQQLDDLMRQRVQQRVDAQKRNNDNDNDRLRRNNGTNTAIPQRGIDDMNRVRRDDRQGRNDGRFQIFDRSQQQRLQQQRWQNYSSRFGNWQNIQQQRNRFLQQQRRSRYLQYQQRYWDRIRQDQIRLQQAQFYNNLIYNYRYNRGGQYYYTSQYGAQMLRNALNNGYEAGFQAGQADRYDNWGYNYQDSYGYQDGTYGYDSYYVDMDEYSHYFREGFQRGYEDGYYGRYQYGSYNNGRYSLLGNVIGTILDIFVD